MTVLNPFERVDERIMDDADLAGPLLFIICFGIFLLFVCVSLTVLYVCIPTILDHSRASLSSGISMVSAS